MPPAGESDAPVAAPRWPARGSRRRTRLRRSGPPRGRLRGRRCASRTACSPAVGQRQHHVGPQRLHELAAPPNDAPGDHPGAHRLCDLHRRGPDAAGRAEHQHRLARPQRAAVVPARSTSCGSCPAAQPLPRHRGQPGSGTRFPAERPPAPRSRRASSDAETRCPGANPDRPARTATTPATSMPGTNGGGTFSWYSPLHQQQIGKADAGGTDVDDDDRSPPRGRRRRRRCRTSPDGPEAPARQGFHPTLSRG